MPNDNKKRNAIARLSICSTALFGTFALSALLPEAIAAGALGVLLDATKGVLMGNIANAVDGVDSLEPDRLSLANEDLARAAGRAIAQIIRDVAKDKSNGYARGTRRDLETIANGAEENWVEIARRETSEERYRELMERNLDELLTAEGESLTKETAMTPEAWGDVFALLNMRAKAGGGFQLDRPVWETIAQQLHENFPKALREALKDDFKRDGKAFAGLTLSLLTDIKRDVAILKLSEAELVAVNERLGEIIERLNAGEREQQAFFREIANNFEKMADQIDDLHQTLHRPPPTREQWRELCGQMLEQVQLRTNAFTNNRGVSPIINDVYVPLALVERREKPQVKPNSPEAESPEGKETEEQLVPTSEDEFLQEVLRLGQSKSQGKRIAVVGEPGSGKTTRLQFIADWILREDLGLPVWVSLADLGDKNISSFLESAWLPMLPEEVSLKELKGRANEVWLLLDGLDEMTARIEWRHVESLLGGWVGEARVIVSCRTNVWEADRNAFSGFDVFRNLEFAPAQVEDYIRKWFGAMEEPAVGEELLAQLAQTPNQRLRELIGNPLRLWMLCQIWQPEVGLPETQAQLYGEFVDWVYDWIFEQMKRLGPSNVVSRALREAVYGYRLRFLEYLAALAVRDWRFFLSHVPGEPERGIYRIFAPEWKQVILLWLVRDDVDIAQKEEFVRASVEFDDGCGEWNLKYVDKGFYEYRAYFLAAAGINEFRDCSLVEEIVEQIVRWGFGYFDGEERGWVTYLSSIEEEAREILKETIRDRAIAPLEKLLVTAADEDIRSEIANSLMEIAPGNEKAIAALEEIMATTADEDTRWEIANSLTEIAPGNEKAIAALEEIMATTADENARWEIANSLTEIAPGNEKAIAVLEERTTTTDERIQNAAKMRKIAPGKEKAIATLNELLANTIDEDTSWQTSSTLEQVAFGNEKTIAALAELLATTTDEYTRQLAAKSLEMIGPGNEKAIAALVELLATTTDKDTRCLVAESLGNMAPGNEKAIAALVELLATSTSTDYSIRFVTALSLGQIAGGNEKAITALVKLLPATTDIHTRRQAVESLGQIAFGNERAFAALEELLVNNTNEIIFHVIALSLEKIAPGNEKAITALVEQLATTTYPPCWETVRSLQKILKTNEQYRLAVSNLKYHLGDELNDTNNLLFLSYFVLWQCAQNLPYPEFYRAWHGHNPDDANPTPQTFDPQQLNRALHQRQLGHTVQPYYIDGSQFVNRDNPAPEIYDQMLDQNSPQRSQGEPTNMQEFKSYWKQQCRQGKPILILYEDPQPPAPQGFSETFLLALSRCGGSICVVWEGETPSGLPTFSPADPDLIEKLVEWMEECGET